MRLADGRRHCAAVLLHGHSEGFMLPGTVRSLSKVAAG